MSTLNHTDPNEPDEFADVLEDLATAEAAVERLMATSTARATADPLTTVLESIATAITRRRGWPAWKRALADAGSGVAEQPG